MQKMMSPGLIMLFRSSHSSFVSIFRRIALFFLVYCAYFSALHPVEEKKRLEFLRIHNEALQTAIYTLSNEDSSIRIRVIGVIHVGEAAYYKRILRMIRDVDYLYYEGIRMNNTYLLDSPQSFLLQRNGENSVKNGIQNISTFQNEFAKYFNLVEQGEYLKPQQNWVNADVNFVHFMEILRNLNIDLDQLSRNLTLDSKIAMEEDSEGVDVINPLDSKTNVIQKYKRKMARYLVRSSQELCYEDTMKLPREAIIIERNKVALSYLTDKFKSPNPLELGLLYGAAHLPHFLEVLQTAHGFQISSVEWLDAWSLQSN